MIYLSRPVFDWVVDYESPTEEIAYDLRPIKLGFGALEYAPTQRQVSRSWTLQFSLRTAAEISSYENWSAALKGRLKGFWLPEPSVVVTVLSSPSPGEILIPKSGLSDAWSTESPLHILIQDSDGALTMAQVTAVDDVSATTERVVFSAALTPLPGWQVRRLLYVRQAEDRETYRVMAEHWESRELKVIELPQEYLDIETGEEPVWLYDFYQEIPGETTPHWRYTSFAETYTSGADEFVPLAINHGEINHSLESDESIQIETVLSDDYPWANVVKEAGEFPLWVKVMKAPFPSGAAEVIFTGVMQSGSVKGRKVSLKFSSWMDAAGSMDGRIPTMVFGPGCPYEVYSAACGVDPVAHQIPITIDSSTDTAVGVSGVGLVAQPANFFSRGRLETGAGGTREIRMILASTAVAAGTCILTVTRPLQFVAAPQAGKVAPGCPGDAATCANTFSNFINFGGCNQMPERSPVLHGAKVNGGGTKK